MRKNAGRILLLLAVLAALGWMPARAQTASDAEQLIARGHAPGWAYAQRGYARREANDLAAAIEDFTAALAAEGLSPEQRHNVESALAEARQAKDQAETQAALERAQAALAKGDFADAADGAQAVLGRDANSEAAMLLRLQALIGAQQKANALADADDYVRRAPGNAALRAQRGFLRRERGDLRGAIDDFTATLAGKGLTAEQQANIKAALAEAQGALRQAAETASRAKAEAEQRARAEAEQRARVQAASRPPTAADIEALIVGGKAPGWAYAQRGLERRKAGNLDGAIADFDAALGRGDLDPKAAADIRYARAEAAATLADKRGKPLEAEAIYRELLMSDPKRADAWYKLGYLMLKRKERGGAADALTRGLEITPVPTAYLDAANAYILSNASLASQQYRLGLDRWYAGDPAFAGRSAIDLERIRNEVVQADASVQTTVGIDTITGRPLDAGGTNNSPGAETRVRFDGRYLPAVRGLEAFASGLTGKDANGVRETDVNVGFRYRPIPDLNFYIGGEAAHFFQPKVETEFVGIWGLGLGADAYPYGEGFKPYWDFGTFGSWRTGDRRVLEDFHGNLGALYEVRGPVRAAIGPTLLAVAGFDNQATEQWAAGVGPSVLSYIWLGGDKYRSYDAVMSVQVGYIFAVGQDERQSGWRIMIAATF